MGGAGAVPRADILGTAMGKGGGGGEGGGLGGRGDERPERGGSREMKWG